MDVEVQQNGNVTKPKKLRKKKKKHLDKDKKLSEFWKKFFYKVWMKELNHIYRGIFKICYSVDHEKTVAGLNFLSRKWIYIDAHRMDKYTFFLRHLLHQHLKLSVLEKKQVINIDETRVDFIVSMLDLYLEEGKRVLDLKAVWNHDEKEEALDVLRSPLLKMAESKNYVIREKATKALNECKNYFYM